MSAAILRYFNAAGADDSGFIGQYRNPETHLIPSIFNNLIGKSNTLKISIGLFLCVIIYYFNNLFNVLGTTEKINHVLSVWIPLIFLSAISMLTTIKINEK